MKKSYIQFIALGSLSALTLAYSCKKFLNKPPVGSESVAGLASKAGVDGLLIGAYSMLDGYTTQGGTGWESSSDNWVWGSVAADDAYKGSNTTDQSPMSPIENHSIDPSDEFLSEKYGFFYNAIQRANDAIREVPLVKDGSVTAAYGAEVIAEARFLRGIYHMEEAKVFRNVPYVDETITYTAGNYNLPNPGPIWDKIEADFMAAMKDLPKTQSEVGRGNYYAAEAFLAKAYMFDHKYTAALPLLQDLTAHGTTSSGAPYALGAFNDNFHAATRNGAEGVFQVQNTVKDGSNGNNGFAGDVLNFPGGGFTSCCGFDQPSYSLANSYKVDANGLPMFTTDPATGLPFYDDVNLGNDHNYKADSKGAYRLSDHNYKGKDPDGSFSGTAFVPPTDALDPRLDWTVGRRGIPYLDWGLCQGENWSRGDVVPYNPIKNVFYEAQAAATSDAFNGWAPNQDVSNNYNMIRYADVILWKAECEVETGALSLAQADVNLIRMRAANPAYWVYQYIDNTNPTKGFSSTPAANYKVGLYGAVGGTDFMSKGKEYARQAVYFERRLELAMEGHRFFDLQRWDGRFGGPEPTGYMAGVLNTYTKADTRKLTGDDNTLPNNPVLTGAKFTAGKNEIFPLYQNEIDISHGVLKQNAGY